MVIYSAIIAMVMLSNVDINEFSFSTENWEFENQLNASHIGSHVA